MYDWKRPFAINFRPYKEKAWRNICYFEKELFLCKRYRILPISLSLRSILFDSLQMCSIICWQIVKICQGYQLNPPITRGTWIKRSIKNKLNSTISRHSAPGSENCEYFKDYNNFFNFVNKKCSERTPFLIFSLL